MDISKCALILIGFIMIVFLIVMQSKGTNSGWYKKQVYGGADIDVGDEGTVIHYINDMTKKLAPNWMPNAGMPDAGHTHNTLPNPDWVTAMSSEIENYRRFNFRYCGGILLNIFPNLDPAAGVDDLINPGIFINYKSLEDKALFRMQLVLGKAAGANPIDSIYIQDIFTRQYLRNLAKIIQYCIKSQRQNSINPDVYDPLLGVAKTYGIPFDDQTINPQWFTDNTALNNELNAKSFSTDWNNFKPYNGMPLNPGGVHSSAAKLNSYYGPPNIYNPAKPVFAPAPPPPLFPTNGSADSVGTNRLPPNTMNVRITGTGGINNIGQAGDQIIIRVVNQTAGNTVVGMLTFNYPWNMATPFQPMVVPPADDIILESKGRNALGDSSPAWSQLPGNFPGTPPPPPLFPTNGSADSVGTNRLPPNTMNVRITGTGGINNIGQAGDQIIIRVVNQTAGNTVVGMLTFNYPWNMATPFQPMVVPPADDIILESKGRNALGDSSPAWSQLPGNFPGTPPQQGQQGQQQQQPYQSYSVPGIVLTSPMFDIDNYPISDDNRISPEIKKRRFKANKNYE